MLTLNVTNYFISFFMETSLEKTKDNNVDIICLFTSRIAYKTGYACIPRRVQARFYY